MAVKVFHVAYRDTDGVKVSDGLVDPDNPPTLQRGISLLRVPNAFIVQDPIHPLYRKVAWKENRWDPATRTVVSRLPPFVAIIQTFDPATGRPERHFETNQPIGVDVEIQDLDGNAVVALDRAEGWEVAIDELDWDTRTEVVRRAVDVIKIQFTNGRARVEIAGFDSAGAFGVHKDTSSQARVEPHHIIVARTARSLPVP